MDNQQDPRLREKRILDAATDLIGAMRLLTAMGVEIRAGYFGEKARPRFMMECHFRADAKGMKKFKFQWPNILEAEIEDEKKPEGETNP